MVNRLLGRGLAAAVLMSQLVLGAGEAVADPLPMRVDAVSAWNGPSDSSMILAGQGTGTSNGGLRRLAVAQLNSNGTLATWFGSGGWIEYFPQPEATSEFRATAVAKHPDGGVVVAVRYDGIPALVRLRSNGSTDYGFGGRGTGMAWDTSSLGLTVRALTVRSDGSIVALGSYSGPDTQQRPVAAIYQYDPNGYLVPQPFGMHLHDLGTGGSELRAVLANPDGSIVAAGYASNAGEKDFLVARFQYSGDLDPAFGTGGKTLINVFAGHDDEAFAIARDGWGRIIAAGRDGHTFSGAAQSNFAVARLDAWGQPDWSFGSAGRLTVSFWNTPFQADATARGVFAMPNTNDVVVGGTLVDRLSGRAYFAIYRHDVDGTDSQGSWGPIVSPMTDGDDFMTAAYTPWEQIVAVGTRESLQGVNALRVRYFADNGEFDTDFSEGENDTTPNPFAFEPYGITVGPAYQAASGTARIGGITTPAPISVTGGEYQIDCTYTGPWLTQPGYVYNGQRVCVRTTSASTPDTTTTVTLTVGSVQAGFSLTTSNVPNTQIDRTPPNPSGTTVQFGYSWERATGTPTQYECRLDGSPWAVCGPAGITYSGLAMGSHVFEVRAVNEWGVDATPSAYAWSVVTVAGTTITSAPAADSNQTPATFHFTSTDPGATFECKLNNGSFQPCTSPRQYAPLTHGTYTFQVRAVNGAGADPTPATWTWNYDTRPPDIGFISGPAGQSSSSTATFSFRTDEPTQFECSLDYAAFAPCPNPVTYSGIAQGFHHFEFRGRDAAGNLAPVTAFTIHDWFVDTLPPDTVLTSKPNATMPPGPSTFEFWVVAETGTLQCALDGAAFAACTSPLTFASLAAGSHTFQVRAIDAVGNVDPTPASWTWTIQAVPETTLDRAPSGFVGSSWSTFEFSANMPATFECSLDAAPYAACSSPLTHSFSEGQHTFAVRAVSGDGSRDPSPATAAWTVDVRSPTLFIVSAPSLYTSSATATFTFGTQESGGVEPGVTFECNLDHVAQFSACANPQTYSGLGEGLHELLVQAVDAAGNRSPTRNHSWNVDLTAPDTLITSGPPLQDAPNTATFVFSADESGVTYECRLDGFAYAACTSPKAYSGLSNGTHTFAVRSIDAVGNTDLTPYLYPWNVNAGYPATVITASPDQMTEATTATFEFHADRPASFTCRLDFGEWISCASPRTYGGLSLGNHVFEVRAFDDAGNFEPGPVTFFWDIVDPPETTITSGPAANSNSDLAIFTFVSDQPNALFECRLDAGGFTPCTSPRAVSAPGGLAPGVHTFSVRARNGMTGALDLVPATWTWTVDLTPPNTAITGGPSGSNNPNSATFTFTSSEGGGTFQCRLDSGTWAACTTPRTYTALARGSHTFFVRAVDAAGNTDGSPASRNWSVR